MKNAYMIGFCKTAEAYGIDPEQLIKTAQTLGFLGRVARGAGRSAGMISQLPSQAARGVRSVGRVVGQAAKGLKQDFMSGWRAARRPAAAPARVPGSSEFRLRMVRPATPTLGKGARGVPGLMQSNTASIVPSRPVVTGLM